MEWFLWLMMLTGAVVLMAGCLILVQERRQQTQTVVAHEPQPVNDR